MSMSVWVPVRTTTRQARLDFTTEPYWRLPSKFEGMNEWKNQGMTVWLITVVRKIIILLVLLIHTTTYTHEVDLLVVDAHFFSTIAQLFALPWLMVSVVRASVWMVCSGTSPSSTIWISLTQRWVMKREKSNWPIFSGSYFGSHGIDMHLLPFGKNRHEITKQKNRFTRNQKNNGLHGTKKRLLFW